MSDFLDLQKAIRACGTCQFNKHRDVRYTGGAGTDFRVMFVAESPSTAGGTGILDPDLNFTRTPRDRLFFEARNRIGLENCYITDLVKCGIPNGKPSLHKLDSCIEYLREEIRIVAPKVIVAVGKSISFQDGATRITYDYQAFLRQRLGETIPICWIYHYAWIYRYKRNDPEMMRIFYQQFAKILRYL